MLSSSDSSLPCHAASYWVWALTLVLLCPSCHSRPSGPTDSWDGGFLHEFDLGVDFSLATNPNGPWRYGYTDAAMLSMNDFRLDGFAQVSGPIEFWHPASGGEGYYPYVAHNSASTTTTDLSNSWALRPSEIAMEASNSGQFAVAVFVVPQAGRYHVWAYFEGVHFRLSTTDVHVRLGDAWLFDAEIDGYGGDPAFFRVQGRSPSATYEETRMLAVSDLLIFAVGYGSDQTNSNDTTGLLVRILQIE